MAQRRHRRLLWRGIRRGVDLTGAVVVRVNVSDGAMAAFLGWPSGVTNIGSGAFQGAVFDGRPVWFAPTGANAVVRVNTGDGSMIAYTSFPPGMSGGSGAFQGGTFDGHPVWLVPHNAARSCWWTPPPAACGRWARGRPR